MNTCSHAPTKEEIRRYMQQRQAQRLPPPDMAQIRRELGWELNPSAPRTNNKRQGA
jgi:hypothetical protein